MAKPVKNEKQNTLRIQPLGDRVVVAPLSKDLAAKSLSGIIIPETVDKEKPERGTVVATGPGKYEDGKFTPMQVKPGDTVLFSKYGYDEIKLDGKDYYVLSEGSVLAIIK